ncbi:hypothetical protein AXG93_1040s1500 [Marchantia polymorpha subsp. ruderalis]|uniref:Integrase catalytic domain-containing protein n=1 Tax=Marchantia polymorpha subsp. ruderalis TaxID=1480154 RepID=A0A176VI66_MARPO|nr:hypothetical protein AXG93_1040s1500 [Marchantia polymorpha subsp. ruderalis]
MVRGPLLILTHSTMSRRDGCGAAYSLHTQSWIVPDSTLFKLLPDDRLCRCLEVTEVGRVIAAMQTEGVGGHYATKNTVLKIKHRKTTPYNPKANGLKEKSNGILCKILLKVTVSHAHDQDTKLLAALWAYRSTEKVTIKQTSYFLTYGQHPILPIEFEVPTHRMLDRRLLEEEESQLYRSQEDLSLEEQRQEVMHRTKQLHLRWMGTYRVVEMFPNGSVQLADLSVNHNAPRFSALDLELRVGDDLPRDDGQELKRGHPPPRPPVAMDDRTLNALLACASCAGKEGAYTFEKKSVKVTRAEEFKFTSLQEYLIEYE